MKLMNQTGSLLKWQLTLAETLSFGITIAVFVYFITNNFVSVGDGVLLKQRVDRVESELSNLRNSLAQIGSDISYIRGRLEPKNK
jgi:membrane protein insertase Oxa1/YidC/SpoIIIJ